MIEDMTVRGFVEKTSNDYIPPRQDLQSLHHLLVEPYAGPICQCSMAS